MRRFKEETFTVFDLETTGGRPESNGILEIALVKIKENQIAETFHTLVNPKFSIPPIVRRMTGITEAMVENAPNFEDIAKQVSGFIDCDILVVHNGPFDYQFLNFHLEQAGQLSLTNPLLCTVKLGHRLIPEAANRKLETLAEHLEISLPNRHRASGDAEATAHLFLHCLERLEKQNVRSLADLVLWMRLTPDPQQAKSQISNHPIPKSAA